jgi:hypothetical protein
MWFEIWSITFYKILEIFTWILDLNDIFIWKFYFILIKRLLKINISQKICPLNFWRVIFWIHLHYYIIWRQPTDHNSIIEFERALFSIRHCVIVSLKHSLIILYQDFRSAARGFQVILCLEISILEGSAYLSHRKKKTWV